MNFRKRFDEFIGVMSNYTLTLVFVVPYVNEKMTNGLIKDIYIIATTQI